MYSNDTSDRYDVLVYACNITYESLTICVAIAPFVDAVSLQLEKLVHEAKLSCLKSVTKTKFTMKRSRVSGEDDAIITL